MHRWGMTEDFIKNGYCLLIIKNAGDGLELFRRSTDYQYYLRLLAKYRSRYRIELFSFCLLPRCVYLIVKFKSFLLMSRFLDDLKASYEIYYQSKYECACELWAPGNTKKPILHDKNLIHFVRWVEERPVEQCLCEDPGCYPFSGHMLRVLNRSDEQNIIAYS